VIPGGSVSAQPAEIPPAGPEGPPNRRLARGGHIQTFSATIGRGPASGGSKCSSTSSMRCARIHPATQGISPLPRPTIHSRADDNSARIDPDPVRAPLPVKTRQTAHTSSRTIQSITPRRMVLAARYRAENTSRTIWRAFSPISDRQRRCPADSGCLAKHQTPKEVAGLPPNRPENVARDSRSKARRAAPSH